MIFSLKLSPLILARVSNSYLIVIFILLFTFGASEVRGQSQENINAILDRMGRLENDIRNLNISIAKGLPAPTSKNTTSIKTLPTMSINTKETVPRHAVARLSVQISELENDLRSVTGAMEKFNFQVGKLANRMDKLVADVDYRLSLLEGNVSVSKSSLPGVPITSAAPLPPSVKKIIPNEGQSFASQPGILGTVSQSSIDALTSKKSDENPLIPTPSTLTKKGGSSSNIRSGEVSELSRRTEASVLKKSMLPSGTTKQQYDYAFGLLRKANYDKAEKALQEFVKNNPNDKLAVNARYWLGETFYVRAAYVQAAEVFLQGYHADPKGKKAADSLLKLGMSLSGLDKKREACSAFDKVIKDFSKISKGMRKTILREKQKNSCP